MDYKSKLQTNNTAIEGNNVDLQTILNTINSLPEAENLDPELSTQDNLIAQITTALEGKTGAGAGGVLESWEQVVRNVTITDDGYLVVENLPEINRFTLFAPDYANVTQLSLLFGSGYSTQSSYIAAFFYHNDGNAQYMRVKFENGTLRTMTAMTNASGETYKFAAWYEE